MALTDEELRIKAAECLGARWYRSVFGSVVGRYLYIVPERHPGVEIVSIPADGTEPLCEGAMKYIPDYPHDIAAAMELFALIPMPCGLERGYEKWHGVGPIGLHVGFGILPPYRDEDDVWAETVWSESGSRAITMAFVLAMTQENDGR
jgi:hypothetical protein